MMSKHIPACNIQAESDYRSTIEMDQSFKWAAHSRARKCAQYLAKYVFEPLPQYSARGPLLDGGHVVLSRDKGCRLAAMNRIAFEAFPIHGQPLLRPPDAAVKIGKKAEKRIGIVA